MAVLTTKGVTIEVKSFYQKKHSSPIENKFIHAYKVTITNEKNCVIKLMERNWTIVDGYGKVRKIHGAGVIGKQPELKPGESHNYVSWCPMPTELGKMSGFYTFIEIESNTAFLAYIPEFSLVYPKKLN
jgi:ApaG protein